MNTKSETDLLNLLNDTNIKISISKQKLKEIEKDFRELRHNFSKEEIGQFRKCFYNIKNHGGIYIPKIKEAEENLSELGESILSIKSSNVDYNNENKSDTKRLFDFFKPKRTDEGFASRRDNYTEYIREGDDNKNLLAEEYLDIARQYLNDLINDHKASGERKIQLVILNRCISSKNHEETRNMYSASKSFYGQ